MNAQFQKVDPCKRTILEHSLGLHYFPESEFRSLLPIARIKADPIKLPFGPVRPTMFLPDAAGHWDNFEFALLARGLVTRTPAGLVPTAAGLNCNIILGGDLNDRGENFVKIVKQIYLFRKAGMQVDVLWGNHELWLNALRGHAAESYSSDILTNWLIGNGGITTTIDLARFYRSKDKGLPTTYTAEELEWIKSIFEDKDPNQILSSCNKQERGKEWQESPLDCLIHARRALDTPLFKEFFALMKLYVHKGPCMLLHSFIDKALLQKYQNLENINRAFENELIDPKRAWFVAHGERTTEEISGNGTLVQRQHLPEIMHTLFMRLGAQTFMPHSTTINKEYVDYFHSIGVHAIFRGHDCSAHFGTNAQSVFSSQIFLGDHPNKLLIVNCDIGLEPRTIMQGDKECSMIRTNKPIPNEKLQTFAYTYISPDGYVYPCSLDCLVKTPFTPPLKKASQKSQAVVVNQNGPKP